MDEQRRMSGIKVFSSQREKLLLHDERQKKGISSQSDGDFSWRNRFFCISLHSERTNKKKRMIKYDLSKITTVIFDVDGVLSENTIPMDLNGNPIRTMNVKDGYAIQLAAKQGIRLAIITGGKCDSIQYRYSKLGVNDIFMGCAVKIEKYREYCRQNNLKDEEVMFLGDDIPDYEIMKVAGCTCCPSDACQEIKDISTYVSPASGGNGFARDVLEQLLKSRGLWLSSAKAFGW